MLACLAIFITSSWLKEVDPLSALKDADRMVAPLQVILKRPQVALGNATLSIDQLYESCSLAVIVFDIKFDYKKYASVVLLKMTTTHSLLRVELPLRPENQWGH